MKDFKGGIKMRNNVEIFEATTYFARMLRDTTDSRKQPNSQFGRMIHLKEADLVVGEGAILVDGVDARHRRADGFALEHRFLFALREQRDVVVDILQDDVDGGLAGQLLDAVVLYGSKRKRIALCRAVVS